MDNAACDNEQNAAIANQNAAGKNQTNNTASNSDAAVLQTATTNDLPPAYEALPPGTGGYPTGYPGASPYPGGTAYPGGMAYQPQGYAGQPPVHVQPQQAFNHNVQHFQTLSNNSSEGFCTKK